MLLNALKFYFIQVENVMNLFGTVILLVITIVSSYVIIRHFQDINEKKTIKKEGIVPTAYYYLIGGTAFNISLPYIKSHALRRYTVKKLSDIFLIQFYIKQVGTGFN